MVFFKALEEHALIILNQTSFNLFFFLNYIDKPTPISQNVGYHNINSKNGINPGIDV